MHVSAYWHVPGNPKKTAGRHIDCLKESPPDILFTEVKLDVQCEQVILPYDKLKIHEFNLRKVSGETTFFKYRVPVETVVFERLRNIWLNKVFLLQEVSKIYPNEKYVTWIDCVHRPYLHAINQEQTDRILMSGITGYPRKPFNRPEKWPQRFCLQGGVIKVPVSKMEQFINTYTSKLLEINNTKETYDEEYVLIHMFTENPNMFQIINDRMITHNDGRSIHSKTQIH